jgi:hypothetical protein
MFIFERPRTNSAYKKQFYFKHFSNQDVKDSPILSQHY